MDDRESHCRSRALRRTRVRRAVARRENSWQAPVTLTTGRRHDRLSGLPPGAGHPGRVECADRLPRGRQHYGRAAADATTTVEVADPPALETPVLSRSTSSDENGQPLPGACFALYADAVGGVRGDLVTRLCDYPDGLRERRNDPRLRPCREGLLLVETKPPPATSPSPTRLFSVNGRRDDHPDPRRPGRRPDRGPQAGRGR